MGCENTCDFHLQQRSHVCSYSGLLISFVIEENATLQSDFSENKDVCFLSPNSWPPPLLSPWNGRDQSLVTCMQWLVQVTMVAETGQRGAGICWWKKVGNYELGCKGTGSLSQRKLDLVWNEPMKAELHPEVSCALCHNFSMEAKKEPWKAFEEDGM